MRKSRIVVIVPRMVVVRKSRIFVIVPRMVVVRRVEYL